MTTPEIEKLAHEWMKDNAPKVWNESAYLEVEKSFKAGYLKGVEMEKERHFKLWQKVFMQYKQHIEGLTQSERMAALRAMAVFKEQIERGSDE